MKQISPALLSAVHKMFTLVLVKIWGLLITKIGDDIIVQKPLTLFKQVTRHRMAFFKIKSTCLSDFLKNIA
jgi:hypothetical protein